MIQSPPMASTEIRHYQARTEAEATAKMQQDAQAGAAYGFRVIQTQWRGPTYWTPLIVGLVTLVIGYFIAGFVIGLVVAIALGGVILVADRPRGTLVVTYIRG